METTLSEKESLELISTMISSAKNNLSKGMGKIYLLWGYVIALLALVNLILLLTLPPHIFYYSYYVWYATPLGLIVYFNLIRKIKEMQMVRTYIDTIVTYVWIAFSIAVLVLVISMLLVSVHGFGEPVGKYDLLNWIQWSFLIPFMLILYGFALFVSGLAYCFRPLEVGAIICWACTLVISLFYRAAAASEIQLGCLILSVIAGYIIPGHMLNIKEKSHVQ